MQGDQAVELPAVCEPVRSLQDVAGQRVVQVRHKGVPDIVVAVPVVSLEIIAVLRGLVAVLRQLVQVMRPGVTELRGKAVQVCRFDRRLE